MKLLHKKIATIKMKLIILLSVFCLESRTLFYLGVREETPNQGKELTELKKRCNLNSDEAYCGCYLFLKRDDCNLEYPNGFAWAPSWAKKEKLVWQYGDDVEKIQPQMTVAIWYQSKGREGHVGDVLYRSKDSRGDYIIYDSGNTKGRNLVGVEGIWLVKLYLSPSIKIYDWVTPKGEKVQKFHVVQRGENLYRLSLKYQTTVEKIRKLNNLQSDILGIGQKVRVS